MSGNRKVVIKMGASLDRKPSDYTVFFEQPDPHPFQYNWTNYLIIGERVGPQEYLLGLVQVEFDTSDPEQVVVTVSLVPPNNFARFWWVEQQHRPSFEQYIREELEAYGEVEPEAPVEVEQ